MRKQNDLVAAELQGPVKSVSTRDVLPDDIHPRLKKLHYKFGNHIAKFIKFNQAGFEIERNTYNHIHSRVEFSFQRYNETGQLIERTNYHGRNHLVNTTSFRYDAQDRLLESIDMSAQQIITQKRIRTYHNNRLHQIITKDKNDIPITICTSTHEGNLITDTTIDQDGSLISKSIILSEPDIHLLEHYEYLPNKLLDWFIKYEYDEHFKFKKVTSKRLTRKIHTTSIMNYFYDGNGLLTSTRDHHDGEVSTSSYTYSLDLHGNWIRKQHYSNEKLRLITERVIEYY